MKSRQLLLFWEEAPSPIEIPKENRKRFVDMTAKLLVAYWKNQRTRTPPLATNAKECEHDR